MQLVTLITLFFYSGNCYEIPIHRPGRSDELVDCITEMVTKFFSPQKVLTYVGNKQDDDEFLEEIHETNSVAMMSRRSSRKLPVQHEGYLISSRNYTAFSSRFPNLAKESTWNPEARFLVVIDSLEYDQLEHVFDALLKKHVINVIVVNGTGDGDLYTYNPFDNYGCGKYYNEIISHGMCSEALKNEVDLYPDKYITGVRNCTFNVLIPNSPPYTMFPKNKTDTSSPLAYGMETYFLQLIGEMDGFKIKLSFDESGRDRFPTVTEDMVAGGALQAIQNNEADILLGGRLLVPSRAVAFDYIYDLLPYVDEIRFIVRRAADVPLWKNVYLEFDSTVWMLLLLSLVLYSMIMIILLRVEDKSNVVLKLLDNLLLHSNSIQGHATVKIIFIIWVWFAYLINSFYQSGLFSLTTNPAMETQISSEADIISRNLKPCFSEMMGNYYMEATQSNLTYHAIPGCNASFESLRTVKDSNDYYTIFIYGLYLYNKWDLTDEYGNPQVYSIKKPFSKVIYSMYLYHGFPLVHELRLSALRVREMGLVDKASSDMVYKKFIKHQFHNKAYGSRFVIPWCVYIFGCLLATITLVLELLSKQYYSIV
ncbi:uncharacterized protein LOC142975270 [Anticarsia gemmatalis]|uniref:uncharacterized protein LOC142975270 n=1 Tax=Anticarsia gemmatalis TaxID=129554 RepID=UPI003F766C91